MPFSPKEKVLNTTLGIVVLLKTLSWQHRPRSSPSASQQSQVVFEARCSCRPREKENAFFPLHPVAGKLIGLPNDSTSPDENN
jgi:hypothetical protein